MTELRCAADKLVGAARFSPLADLGVSDVDRHQQDAPFLDSADAMTELRCAADKLVGAARCSPLADLGVSDVDRQQQGLFCDIDESTKAEVARLAKELCDVKLDRAIGSMVGMAIADSIGHNFEFLPVCDTTDFRGQHFEYPSTVSGGAVRGCRPGGQFALQPGQWTDDTSMALCIADSLLVRGGYDGSDIRIWFQNWWYNGLNNAFRLDHQRQAAYGRWQGGSLSVGLGGNIAKSLAEVGRFARTAERPPPRFQGAGEDAGNGSLMRLAPVPIFFHANIGAARRMAYESSLTTHPGPLAGEACAFLAHLIVRALHRDQSEPSAQTAAQFIDREATEYIALLQGTAATVAPGAVVVVKGLKSKPEYNGQNGRVLSFDLTSGRFGVRMDDGLQMALKPEVMTVTDMPAQRELLRLLRSEEKPGSTEWCWNWRDRDSHIWATLGARGQSYNGYPVSPGYFGSFSLDGLALALHCVYHTTSFGEAIAKVVNHRGDADSTGAICAQIAGAFYGASAIDRRWVEDLEQWDHGEIALRAIALYVTGRGSDDGNRES